MASKKEYRFKSDEGKRAAPVAKESMDAAPVAKEKEYRYKSEDGRSAMLLIGVLIIAVILVGGGLLYIIMQKKGVEPVTPVTPPPKNLSNATNQTPVIPVCDASCLYQKALASGDPAMCPNLSAEFIQPCYEAMSNASLDACKAVADTEKKQSCLTAFAVAGNNISLCDLAANRAVCRRTVDPCADAADKALCRALAKSDPSQCDSDMFCLLNYSTIKKNVSSCDLIQNPVVSTACTALVKRLDRCSDLQFQAQKDYCHELYAIYTNNYLECTQIYPDSSYGLDCFSSFAASMHNLSICDQDSLSLNSLWACYINYSLATGDISGCLRIDPLATTNLYACASKYANKFGDPSACEIITNTLTMRATCYEGAIIYFNRNLNWSNCAAVTDFNWKNKCYTEAAKIYKDPSICNYATAEFARQSCRDSYAANQTTG